MKLILKQKVLMNEDDREREREKLIQQMKGSVVIIPCRYEVIYCGEDEGIEITFDDSDV